MYTLRIVMENHTENIFLGKSYAVVTDADNPKHFKELAESKGYNTEYVYAEVHSDATQESIALSKSYKCYIMTESGKTFSNISYGPK